MIILIDSIHYSTYMYRYVMGGETTSIQRLKLNVDDLLSQPWETISTELIIDNENCDIDSFAYRYGSGGFLLNNLIYVIGGSSSSVNDDNGNKLTYSCIITFDILTENVSYWDNFPYTITGHSITYVQCFLYYFLII